MAAVMFIYNLMLNLAALAALPMIAPMLIFSAKRRRTFFRRWGLHTLPKGTDPAPGGLKPIWIHALSVGEVLSAEPLVGILRKRFPRAPLLFSVTTYTGHQIAQSRLRPFATAVFYFPFDWPFAVKRTAALADAGLVIIVETDIWPNFLREMKRRGVPVILANARISRKSLIGYHRLRFFTAPMFRSFSHICAQSDEDAESFRQLGVPSHRITVTGNIKFDRSDEDSAADAMTEIRRQLGIDAAHPVLLAGSTHEGEETILKEAFLRLKRLFPDLVLVIVPRNPDRAASIRRQFSADHLRVRLLNPPGCDPGGGDCDVVLVNAVGMLNRMYALADVAFVGGSLVNAGGHNPLEPAAYSKPILFGPDMSDFKDIARMMIRADAARRVCSADALFEAVRFLLQDGAASGAMGARAYGFFVNNRGAAEKTAHIVESFFRREEMP